MLSPSVKNSSLPPTIWYETNSETSGLSVVKFATTALPKAFSSIDVLLGVIVEKPSFTLLMRIVVSSEKVLPWLSVVVTVRSTFAKVSASSSTPSRTMIWSSKSSNNSAPGPDNSYVNVSPWSASLVVRVARTLPVSEFSSIATAENVMSKGALLVSGTSTGISMTTGSSTSSTETLTVST